MFAKGLITSTIVLATQAKHVSKCWEVPIVENFETSKYMGTWYEQSRDKAFMFEGGDCSTATYRLEDNGKITVRNNEYFFDESRWN